MRGFAVKIVHLFLLLFIKKSIERVRQYEPKSAQTNKKLHKQNGGGFVRLKIRSLK